MSEPARILVISPHPDDESIGCGGTLHAHTLAGDLVHVVFLTSGEQGGHGRPPEETGPLREREAREAARILGLANVEFWREPDGALRATPRLVRLLLNKISELRPKVVFVPHAGEMHPDHQAAARLVRRAIRRLAANDQDIAMPEIWMFEIWTPVPRIDQIIDISSSLDVKLAAVRTHQSQCEVMRFDEACRGLARYRGEMHLWPGGDYAEAFQEWRPARPASASSLAALHPTSHGGDA